jgi:hypothetical protein
MEVISQETGLTISVVVLIISAVVWLTKMWAEERANGKAITALKQSHEEALDSLRESHAKAHSSFQERLAKMEADYGQVTERMARIETKIDFLIESIKK